MKDECGRPMLLKLKDWPPGEDFRDALPEWFDDVMKAFPVAQYTSRAGKLNLASYLPEKFIPPDLVSSTTVSIFLNT
jgi:lysine-specific demethylase 3